MNLQDKEYYDALLEMFTDSKGWKYFVEEINKWYEGEEKNWHTVNSSDEFFMSKGKLQVLTYITNFEEVVKNHLRQAEEDNADV